MFFNVMVFPDLWLVFMVIQGIFMVFHFFKFTIVNDAIFCLTIRTDVFEVC